MKLLTVLIALVLSVLAIPAFAEEVLPTAVNIDFMTMVIGLWSALNAFERVIAALYLLVPVFSIIVSLTPTPRDNLLLGKAYKLLELFALQVFRAKQTPGLKIDRNLVDRALK